MRNTNENARCAYLASGGVVLVSQSARLTLQFNWNLKLQHKSLLEGFQCTLISPHVFAPLRQFDGQMLKGKVSDAQINYKKITHP